MSGGRRQLFPTPRPLVQTSLPAPLGPSSPRAHFVGLAPLPHPGCVGRAGGEAVTRVRLQLHQLHRDRSSADSNPERTKYDKTSENPLVATFSEGYPI